MVREGLGDLDLNKSFSVRNLAGEIPGAVGELAWDNRGNIAGAVLGAGIVTLAMPGIAFAQDGGPVVPADGLGDLIKTLALPLILGAGNAYRAWHGVNKDVSRIQEEIDRRIEAANETSGITSVDDIVWLSVAKQLHLDPAASPEERELVLAKIDPASLEKLRVNAEQELETIPETVVKLTNEVKEMSKKRNKIWRRGARQIPFEFGQGFFVGCFGMALLQPDGAPTMVEKFFNSTDLVAQAENGLYLSGYAYAAVTAAIETWKLQQPAGGRGRVAEETKAHLKRMKEDAGEDVKENKRPKLNVQAKAMAGDPVAKARMKMNNGQ